MQPVQPKPRFGDQVPPAIFPPLLGLMGLVLALGRSVDVLGVPKPLADLAGGMVTLLLLFAVLAYGLKLVRRFGTLAEDLRTLPGRAGTAALIVALYCLAALLVPLSSTAAMWVLFSTLAGHLVLVVLKVRFLLSIPAEQRQITPVWHLSFVGFIVAVLSAYPLGYHVLSYVVFSVTLPIAVIIWVLGLKDLFANGSPPPLRPTMAIHLAPASLFTLVTGLFGWTTASMAFGILAVLILIALLLKARWLTAAGFSPFWGAFTFPLAAFCSAMLSVANQHQAFGILAALALAGAMGIIPAITIRVLKLWARGQLALKTNAARV